MSLYEPDFNTHPGWPSDYTITTIKMTTASLKKTISFNYLQHSQIKFKTEPFKAISATESFSLKRYKPSNKHVTNPFHRLNQLSRVEQKTE